MRVDREALIKHLEKVYCRGQVDAAVFGPAWECWALTVDHRLLLHAPPLKGTAPLPELVGIADLRLLIRTLKDLPGDGIEQVVVVIRHEGDRLVIDKDHRGVIRLMTSSPHVIASYRDKDEVAVFESRLPHLREESELAIALSRSALDGAVTAARRFGSAEGQIVVQKDGAVWLQVGNEYDHMASLPLRGAPGPGEPEEYRVYLGAHLWDVLSTIKNYTNAKLHLAGPEGLVRVTDSGYEYLLSPSVPPERD